MKRLALAVLSAALLALAAPAHAASPAPRTLTDGSSIQCVKPTKPPVQIMLVARQTTAGGTRIDDTCGNGWGP
ncbi:hypothetical protein [Streptomyces sp. NPDC089915]|uniref:hypothetical protein n=1 Tax=Streptomyces sp. NPDC089915 TaxID=3155186 RepID=UPI0034185B05